MVAPPKAVVKMEETRKLVVSRGNQRVLGLLGLVEILMELEPKDMMVILVMELEVLFLVALLEGVRPKVKVVMKLEVVLVV
ncbi:hypothetical protein L6164_030634 [Bauhinia variegata]|uniref:Uncharacterized protein n=1 Tax=Bauhinia variegata TaxID=167791 RepID=A0ACB9LCY8_BAUVA|nr:hypothetical protein L6164_030634 [Bauhinia variegata]